METSEKHDPDRMRAALAAAGYERERGRAMVEHANDDLRKLAPLARDAGLTVQAIADAYGITRGGLYEVMKRSAPGRCPKGGTHVRERGGNDECLKCGAAVPGEGIPDSEGDGDGSA